MSKIESDFHFWYHKQIGIMFLWDHWGSNWSITLMLPFCSMCYMREVPE